MIDGIFKKKYLWNTICLFCSLFLIGLFVFIRFTDKEASNGIFVGIVFGAIWCILNLISLLFNFKAFVRVEEKRIKGKYHWFGKIDCDISDIDFVLPQINTLTIKLKNGKNHAIMGIVNSFDLCYFIRRRIHFENTDTPEELIEKLNGIKYIRKKFLLLMCFGLVLMFVNIFITVFLTGGKDLNEFNKSDWIIMAVMAVVEFATVLITFYFAKKSGGNIIPIEQLKYTINRRIIETAPLPSGNIRSVYTDDDFTGRLIVFGYPNEDSVYYSVQKLNFDYTIETLGVSEVLENEELLPDEIHNLIDITEEINN